MPFAFVSEPVRNTILIQLGTLLLAGANDDREAAFMAAVATIRAFDPQTEAEFLAAARAVLFSLQAGEALAEAAAPGLSLTQAMRLRSSAISLSRESSKAERRLERLRKERLQVAKAASAAMTSDVDRPAAPQAAQVAAEPSAPAPAVDAASTGSAPREDTVAAYAAAHGLSWTEARRQRERDQRLAARREREALREQAA